MKGFADALLAWYAEEKRELPWRSDPTPYRVWISEIMLQQTQVETVKPYYENFMKCFPDVQSLAAAPEAELLKAWEGLGYYTRARNLQKAAKTIAHDYDGVFPASFDDWLKLSGIGTYTAAAIVSIALGVPVPVVDGNVLRVCARLWADDADIKADATKRKFFEALTPIIEASGDPSSFNQAMMELGALICKPKSPQCLLCPVNRFCTAFGNNTVAAYPVVSKRAPLPHRHAVALVAEHGDAICFVRRSERLWHGLYVFPLVTVDAAPDDPSVVRAMFEAADLTPKGAPEALKTVRHTFTHFTLDIHPWRVRVTKKSGAGEWQDRAAVTLPLPVPIRHILEKQLQK